MLRQNVIMIRQNNIFFSWALRCLIRQNTIDIRQIYLSGALDPPPTRTMLYLGGQKGVFAKVVQGL